MGKTSDLFHEKIPDEFVDRVFARMALSSRQTFLVLTKRPERMRAYFQRSVSVVGDVAKEILGGPVAASDWPLPNVWLGVSVDDQRRADERIPWLLRTPAAVRFLSVEPLLAPVVLPSGIWCRHHQRFESVVCMDESRPCFRWQANALDMLSWVIVGGEIGPDARPCHLDWVRSLVRQCRDAGVSVFCKRLGANVVCSEAEARARRACDRWSLDGAGGARVLLRDRNGGDVSEFPEDLRVREFPR